MIFKNKRFVLYIGCFVFYFALSILTYLVVGSGLHLMLIWNLFLALIPFLIGLLIKSTDINRVKLLIILFFIWLLFYPNAIYIFTDFIYLDSVDFIQNGINPYMPSVYVKNFPAYLAFFHILIGAFLGLFYGYTSLFDVYHKLKNSKFKKYANAIMLTVFLLSGVAIYIGRFFRYNSWDFIKVFQIISDLVLSFDWFMIFFVGALFIVQVMIFYFLKWFHASKSS